RLEDARRMASEALAFHIKAMAEDGDQSMTYPGDPAMKQAVVFLVPIDLEKTVRVNITARESQMETIDPMAGEAGMTRSAYMVQSALGGDLYKNARRRRDV